MTSRNLSCSLIASRSLSLRRTSQSWRAISAAVTLLAASSSIAAAEEETPLFTVNSTADGADGAPGDGVCETAPGNGVCTLRAAIGESFASALDGAVAFDISPTDPGYNGTRWTIGR